MRIWIWIQIQMKKTAGVTFQYRKNTKKIAQKEKFMEIIQIYF